MMINIIENNQVMIKGTIASDFTYSHEIFGEGFYLVDVKVERLSDTSDVIPVMVSDRLLDVNENYKGKFVEIFGQYRSYNKHDGHKNTLVLSVFVREVGFVDEGEEKYNTNQIYLDGFICKAPVYRKTPLGREVTDVLVAVNRPYGKTDYIPCICWGRNARYAASLLVGTRCEINGRIQSREYFKKISEEEAVRKVAYEVSISKLEVKEWGKEEAADAQ